MNEINVREILREPDPLFIKPQGPDKSAAAERIGATYKFFEEWYNVINSTNLRGIPTDLYKLYEEAAVKLCLILAEEKKIVTKR